MSETCGRDSDSLQRTGRAQVLIWQYPHQRHVRLSPRLRPATFLAHRSPMSSQDIRDSVSKCFKLTRLSQRHAPTACPSTMLCGALASSVQLPPRVLPGSISRNPFYALWYASGSDKIATVLDVVDESMNSAHKLLRPGPYYAGLLYVHHPSSTCGAGSPRRGHTSWAWPLTSLGTTLAVVAMTRPFGQSG